jgi:hypothetical protein
MTAIGERMEFIAAKQYQSIISSFSLYPCSREDLSFLKGHAEKGAGDNKANHSSHLSSFYAPPRGEESDGDY